MPKGKPTSLAEMRAMHAIDITCGLTTEEYMEATRRLEVVLRRACKIIEELLEQAFEEPSNAVTIAAEDFLEKYAEWVQEPGPCP